MSNIAEGNKLIAEFMGMQVDPHTKQGEGKYMRVWIHTDEPTFFHCEWHPEYDPKDQKFLAWCFAPHENWCQLMPVVEKIRELGFKFIIGDSNRVTVYNKDYDWRNGSTSDTMIECVWHGCTQFIQWYNKNKNP